MKRHRTWLSKMAKIPPWICICLSILTYLLLTQWVSPQLQASTNPTLLAYLPHWQEALSIIAPLLSIVLLLPVYVAVRTAYIKRNAISSHVAEHQLAQLSWLEFEALVSDNYRQQGYKVTQKLDYSDDDTVDMELTKGQTLILVNCKYWQSSKVGVKAVRELYDTLLDRKAGRAILLTCGTFTPEATTFARYKPIELVDGVLLAHTLFPSSPMLSAN